MNPVVSAHGEHHRWEVVRTKGGHLVVPGPALRPTRVRSSPDFYLPISLNNRYFKKKNNMYFSLPRTHTAPHARQQSLVVGNTEVGVGGGRGAGGRGQEEEGRWEEEDGTGGEKAGVGARAGGDGESGCARGGSRGKRVHVRGRGRKWAHVRAGVGAREAASDGRDTRPLPVV